MFSTLPYVDHVVWTLNKCQKASLLLLPLFPHFEEVAAVLSTAVVEAVEQWHAHRHWVHKGNSDNVKCSYCGRV